MLLKFRYICGDGHTPDSRINCTRSKRKNRKTVYHTRSSACHQWQGFVWLVCTSAGTLCQRQIIRRGSATLLPIDAVLEQSYAKKPKLERGTSDSPIKTAALIRRHKEVQPAMLRIDKYEDNMFINAIIRRNNAHSMFKKCVLYG